MINRKKLWQWIVLCIGILLIVYGSVSLVVYLSDMNRARQTTEELREIAAPAEPTESPLPAETPGTEPLPQETETPAETVAPEAEPVVSGTLPAVEYPNGYALVSRIQELRKKSEYIIGWITMDDLDEPVVMKDNSFFLDHDAMGKKNSNGAIFMDEGTNLLTRPYTILLYGHNMKTGMMFGNLRKYEDQSYCFKHRMLRFDTLYEEGQYEIFAVATVSLTPGKARYVNLTGLRSSDRETRREALDTLVHAGTYQGMANVSEEDQILLLITCVGDDDERLVVAAVRVDR